LSRALGLQLPARLEAQFCCHQESTPLDEILLHLPHHCHGFVFSCFMKNADDAGILSATTVLAKFLGQPTLVMGTHEQSKVTLVFGSRGMSYKDNPRKEFM